MIATHDPRTIEDRYISFLCFGPEEFPDDLWQVTAAVEAVLERMVRKNVLDKTGLRKVMENIREITKEKLSVMRVYDIMACALGYKSYNDLHTTNPTYSVIGVADKISKRKPDLRKLLEKTARKEKEVVEVSPREQVLHDFFYGITMKNVKHRLSEFARCSEDETLFNHTHFVHFLDRAVHLLANISEMKWIKGKDYEDAITMLKNLLSPVLTGKHAEHLIALALGYNRHTDMYLAQPSGTNKIFYSAHTVFVKGLPAHWKRMSK